MAWSSETTSHRAGPDPPVGQLYDQANSFGEAFIEIILDRGLDATGVAIDAEAVRRILKRPLSQLRAGFPILKALQRLVCGN